jgi:hypothetical protein
VATHRVYGTVRVAGAAAVRALDVVDAADWQASGLAAAVVATATSDGMTGEWSADLDSDAMVYVLARPVPPYKPLLLGPYRPVPL